MTDYSATPLATKLGIREGSVVGLSGAPPAFASSLDPLPSGAVLRTSARGRLDVAVLFVARRARLERAFGPLARAIAPAGGLWVAWPKKSSGIAGDLSFGVVQAHGLAAGLVDNKSCSIDERWQGLRFVYRLKDRRLTPR